MVVVEVTTVVEVVVLGEAVMVTAMNPLVTVLVFVVNAVEVVVTGVATSEQAEETTSAIIPLITIQKGSVSNLTYQGHSRVDPGQHPGGQPQVSR